MLKIFTIGFSKKSGRFDDTKMREFLAGREILRWEQNFFEMEGVPYWTFAVHYINVNGEDEKENTGKKVSNRHRYKQLLTEEDWPLFEILREWRSDRAKEDDVPSYVVFNNIELAKICVTRPGSLNALSQIDGIGKGKLEKYGKAVLNIVEDFSGNNEESKKGTEDNTDNVEGNPEDETVDNEGEG